MHRLIPLLLFCTFCAAAEVQLIGNVDKQTEAELQAFFRDGAHQFAGGYIVGEFAPGLDRYIVSIRNEHGNYIVTMRERPCKKTVFSLIKFCFPKGRCHWDLDTTYQCIQNKAASH